MVSIIGRWAEGCSISRLPDGRSCRNPLPTAIDSQGALESPPLAKMAQGEVLTLSMHKAGKMNGQGPEGSKS